MVVVAAAAPSESSASPAPRRPRRRGRRNVAEARDGPRTTAPGRPVQHDSSGVPVADCRGGLPPLRPREGYVPAGRSAEICGGERIPCRSATPAQSPGRRAPGPTQAPPSHPGPRRPGTSRPRALRGRPSARSGAGRVCGCDKRASQECGGEGEAGWQGGGGVAGGGKINGRRKEGFTGWKEGEDQGRDTAEGPASDPTPTHRGLSKAEALLGQCRVTLDRRSFLSNDGPAAEVSGAARRTRARAASSRGFFPPVCPGPRLASAGPASYLGGRGAGWPAVPEAQLSHTRAQIPSGRSKLRLPGSSTRCSSRLDTQASLKVTAAGSQPLGGLGFEPARRPWTFPRHPIGLQVADWPVRVAASRRAAPPALTFCTLLPKPWTFR